MYVSSTEATIVATTALIVGFAVGWCLGWFRGFRVAVRPRRQR